MDQAVTVHVLVHVAHWQLVAQAQARRHTSVAGTLGLGVETCPPWLSTSIRVLSPESKFQMQTWTCVKSQKPEPPLNDLLSGQSPR